MSTGKLLGIEPLELKFPFELKKQISCSLQLLNKTDSYVAFKMFSTKNMQLEIDVDAIISCLKVKTTNPKKYCVRPNTGIVLPRSTCDVTVTMQAQKEAPPELQCKDKFLLQSVKTSDGSATTKAINAEMFNKEAGNIVEEFKLRVVYVSPPQPPSPVTEGSEEGSPPRDSNLENGNVTRAFVEQIEPQEKSVEARALIAKLSDEKKNAIQQNKKLLQELGLLRRESNRYSGGVSFLLVIFVGIIGIIFGYLVKRT